MAYNIRVHNPGPYEVVMDMRGRILPGHTSTDADRDDRYTSRLLSKGVLLEIGQLSTLAEEEDPAPKASRTSTKTTKSTASAGAETGDTK